MFMLNKISESESGPESESPKYATMTVILDASCKFSTSPK